MIEYMNCKRNGNKQFLDSRACLACACQLSIRRQCKAFKNLSNEQVQQDVVWLQSYGYVPHNFTIRLKKLDMEETNEVAHEQMQGMRQHHDTKRNESKTITPANQVRGSVLTVQD